MDSPDRPFWDKPITRREAAIAFVGSVGGSLAFWVGKNITEIFPPREGSNIVTVYPTQRRLAIPTRVPAAVRLPNPTPNAQNLVFTGGQDSYEKTYTNGEITLEDTDRFLVALQPFVQPTIARKIREHYDSLLALKDPKAKPHYFELKHGSTRLFYRAQPAEGGTYQPRVGKVKTGRVEVLVSRLLSSDTAREEGDVYARIRKIPTDGEIRLSFDFYFDEKGELRPYSQDLAQLPLYKVSDFAEGVLAFKPENSGEVQKHFSQRGEERGIRVDKNIGNDHTRAIVTIHRRVTLEILKRES